MSDGFEDLQFILVIAARSDSYLRAEDSLHPRVGLQKVSLHHPKTLSLVVGSIQVPQHELEGLSLRYLCQVLLHLCNLEK